MHHLSEKASTPPKAQQDPQFPWFLISLIEEQLGQASLASKDSGIFLAMVCSYFWTLDLLLLYSPLIPFPPYNLFKDSKVTPLYFSGFSSAVQLVLDWLIYLAISWR